VTERGQAGLAEAFADIARQLQAEGVGDDARSGHPGCGGEQLEGALQSNREIGMAIGVLMGRGGMTQDEAFALLRRASQHLHRKLREVAAEVVDTGQLPDRPQRRRRD